MPIIAATDRNTDIGDVIENNDCGFKVVSGDLKNMLSCIDAVMDSELKFQEMQNNAWQLLQKEYLVARSYNSIIDKVHV